MLRGRAKTFVEGPVDYTDLRTEFIGLIYEGLLDYRIKRTDAESGPVVPITYRKDTTITKDAHGNIATVHVTIPAGTSMPSSVRAYVVSDVYPLLVKVL